MKQPHEAFPPHLIVIADASVFLNFAFVRKLDLLVSWFNQKIAVTSIVKEEVFKVSIQKPEFGPNLNLEKYIAEKRLIFENMDSSQETIKYYGYVNRKFGNKIFNDGESSCLAVALTKKYGLICDERQVLDEFLEEKKFEAPAWTSKQVVASALREKLISKTEADEIYLGFENQI